MSQTAMPDKPEQLTPSDREADGHSLLEALLRKPIGGSDPLSAEVAQTTPEVPKRPAHFIAVRTMLGGYWIDCEVNMRTQKGVRITNGERTIWLPKSQLYQIGASRIRASDYIVNERYRDIIATDPEGVHEKSQKSLIGLKPVEWKYPGGDTL